MCGIVGYVGNRPVVDLLIQGLRHLEYRGYDSAGVAFFRDGIIEIEKSEGRLVHVEKLLAESSKVFQGSKCGIGHTRWATHGKPTTQNAHPHRTGHVVLVHNGIIENYQEVRKQILERGHRPLSETDSELFGFLVLEEMNRGLGLRESVRKSFLKIRGSCTMVVMSEKEPGVVVGVRNGTPLVAANDPLGGGVFASDAQGLLHVSKNVVFLEHGDLAEISEKGLEVFDLKTGKTIQRNATLLDWSVEQLDKQGHAHYMLKEIYEQPSSLMDTLNALVERSNGIPFSLAHQPAVKLIENARDIHIVACGTSWHAALLAKYWMEKWARIPVNVELASEFRYRDPVVGKSSIIIGLAQSGETADTLAVIRKARAAGIPTVGITNIRGSTISREADAVLYMAAGPEVGVAATKTFTAQLMTLLVLTGHLAVKNSQAHPDDQVQGIQKLFEQVIQMPHLLADYLEAGKLAKDTKKAARALKDSRGFFFIGRGFSFPIALEGALKLKEIAYIHAEGYAGGELKHGPIAMIDQEMTVVVLAPLDIWREKTVSNLEEVKARGARILGIGDASDLVLQSLCDHWIALPPGLDKIDSSLFPLALTPVVQLLSYEIALLKGTDVDKPRNLAKSVTVE